MTDRPSRDELVLKFFPEIKENKGADTEGAIALNVRACEAVLSDLIDLYDEGLELHGHGILVLRLHEGAKHSGFLTLDEMRADLKDAQKHGNIGAATFFQEVIDAIEGHNHSAAALVALVDNSRSQVIPIDREYPARAIQAMLKEAAQ